MTSGWWLSHPSEKYEFFSWDYGIPSVWTVIKFMFQSTNQHIYLEQPQARIWAWMCLGFFFCLTLEFSPESKFLPERVFYIFAQFLFPKLLKIVSSPILAWFPGIPAWFPGIPAWIGEHQNTKIALKTRTHTLSQNWQFQPEWTISPESMLRLKSSPSPKKATIWFQA